MPLFETLHHAATSPDDAVAPVAALLANGHNVNATDKESRTPLMLAVRHDNPKIVDLLLENGADVNAIMPRGFTALHYAARHARLEIAQTLVTHGANVNAAMDHGLTVAHISAEDGRLEVFKYLVEHGADPNASMTNGVTLLHAATRQGRLEIVKYLVEEHGLDINAASKSGVTALHDAAADKQLEVLKYLLDKGADINAVDRQRRSPLHRAIWGALKKCSDSYPVVRILCDRNAPWDPSCEREMARTMKMMHRPPKGDGTERMVDPNTLWRVGIHACMKHWHHQREDDPTAVLQEIPLESVKRGADAVATYLANIQASSADELVLRRKICVVGPSEWGKTSLVKSLTSLEPSLVHIDARTIGIDLFSHSFIEKCAESNTTKRHEVTFWDFAGQDEYQVAHAMFFSKRTLYLLCVDLEKYDLAWQASQNAVHARDGENAMARFLRANIFRWVRAIVSRQADAEFVVVGTKLDKVESESHANRLWMDLSWRLSEWMKAFAQEVEYELAQVGGRLSGEAGGDVDGEDASHEDRSIFQSLKATLQHLFTKDWLVVSSASVDSILQAREALELKITGSGSRSFLMPIKYTRVLESICRRREEAARMSTTDRIANTIVPVRALCSSLMREIDDLEGDECREILQTLHDLGDVLWYQNEASGVLKDTVILDPTLVLDFVREIVTHEYAKTAASEPAAYVEEGRLTHEIVQSRPLWRDLDDELTFAFKQLLQYFQLAYPADNSEMDWDSDLIIPTYWKLSDQGGNHTEPQRRLRQQASMVKRHGLVDAASHFCWEYELSAEVSETVFEHLAVQSYSSSIKRLVRPKRIEAFVQDDCAALITLSASGSSRDIIRMEAAVVDVRGGWQYLRYYVMALETVLDGYPGLLVSRYVVDSSDDNEKTNRHRLSRALNMLQDARWMGKDESTVWERMPWLPRDIDWFIEKAWRTPGALQQLRTQELVREVVSKVDVLKKLVVANDIQRRFPALWTLEYDPQDAKKPTVRIRMLSDLSGECFHDPIAIELPPSFFAKHGNLLQAGVAILSNVVPEIVSLGIFQKVIDALSPVVDSHVARATTLYNLIDQFDLSSSGSSRSVVEPVTSKKLSPRGAVALLRDLLTLHDASFDELTIYDLAKLQCAATADGHYIWAHRQEIMVLGDQFTPCDPQDVHTALKRTLSSASTSSSSSLTSSVSSIKSSDTPVRLRLSIASISGLAAWDWRKTYCHWQLVHPTKGLLGSGATPQHVEYSMAPSWEALEFTLSKIQSVELLSECSLSIRVKRPSRCLGVVKLLAEGALPLVSVVSTEFESLAADGLTIRVPLDFSDAPSRFVSVNLTS